MSSIEAIVTSSSAMERLSCLEPGCGATFTNNANRVVHYRAQHQNLRSDPCPMCSLHGETKTFYSQSGLRTHYSNVHGLVLGSDADPLSSNQRESLPQVQRPLPQARIPSQPGGLFGRLEPRSLSLHHGCSYYGPRNAFAFFRAREEGKEDDGGQSDRIGKQQEKGLVQCPACSAVCQNEVGVRQHMRRMHPPPQDASQPTAPALLPQRLEARAGLLFEAFFYPNFSPNWFRCRACGIGLEGPVRCTGHAAEAHSPHRRTLYK